MSRLADDFVTEWLAGKGIVGQGDGNIGELRGESATVLGGMKTQGLDVPQEGDALIEPPLSPPQSIDTLDQHAGE